MRKAAVSYQSRYRVAYSATCTQVYRKVPKFLNARKFCCNLPKIQTKRPNHRVFSQNVANGIANSEDPDQTAPLLSSALFAHTCMSKSFGSFR